MTPSQFETWLEVEVLLVLLVNVYLFSYLSKFHANIISGSSVMTIFPYKGLTRNARVTAFTASELLRENRQGGFVICN